MAGKTNTIMNKGKLADCAWFFGWLIGITAITGMAWECQRPKSEKQKCRKSGVDTDAAAAKKEPDK